MYFYLPVTPNGCAVIYHRLSNSKPSNYVFDEAIKAYLMTIGELSLTVREYNFVLFLTVKNAPIFLSKQIVVCIAKVHVMELYFCLT